MVQTIRSALIITVVHTFNVCWGGRHLANIYIYSSAADGEPVGRNLPLFTVIRFPNAPCRTPTGQKGICYSFQECRRLNGLTVGYCASGYGVCCLLQYSCGTVTNQNCTQFVNPGYPGDYTDSGNVTCTYTLVRPPRIQVCQVRLDFLDFRIGRPTEGSCLTDQFTVHGQNKNSVVPTLCGVNTGQHMYIDVDMVYSPLVLKITTRGPDMRRWNIMVTFIECSSSCRAPSNCLQYYKGTEGSFSSFNYVPDVLPEESGGYLNNVDYSICFRKEAGHCSQTYFIPNENAPFVLFNVDANNAPSVNSGEAGLGVTECPSDYVLLGGDRYCGTRLNSDNSPRNPTSNSPVTDSSTGPFIARFATNSEENGFGFKLEYRQGACSRSKR